MTQKNGKKIQQSSVKTNNKSAEVYKLWIFRTLLAVVFVIPLVVHLMVVPVAGHLKPFVGNLDYAADFFVAYKVLFLIILTIALLLMTFHYQLDYAGFKKGKKFFIGLGSIATVVLLSTLLSPIKDVAFFGYIDRYEGAITWFSYLALAYIAFVIVDTDRMLKQLKLTFIASASVVAFIGVLQYFGLDIFKTELGKMLILGSRYAEAGSQLVFPFPERTVYSTLYNSNYVGSMMSISIVLTLESLFKRQKLINYVLITLALATQMIALIGSKSTGGLIALVVATMIVLIAGLFKLKIARWMKAGVLGIVVLALALVFLQVDAVKTTTQKLYNQFAAESDMTSPFTEVDYKEQRLVLKTDQDYFIILTPYGNVLDVTTSTGVVLEPIKAENTVTYEASVDKDKIRVVHQLDNGALTIGILRDTYPDYKTVKIQFRNGQFGEGLNILTEKNVKVDVLRLFKNEALFTERGKIWNRTIPLILTRPILGYGADNFAPHYPQLDLLGSVYAIEPYDVVVDKPHNILLGLAMNFGVIGGLVLLAIFIRLWSLQRGIWSTAAITAFSIAGLVNDSIVAITFFVILLMVASMKKQQPNL